MIAALFWILQVFGVTSRKPHPDACQRNMGGVVCTRVRSHAGDCCAAETPCDDSAHNDKPHLWEARS